MKEHELRALVREAVARHLGDRGDFPADAFDSPPPVPLTGNREHASHAVYLQIVNVDDRCVIEPGVACNHCNYCRSHGH
ncbi:MAG TPA: hypothetical protein VF424_10595 [Vicinamibacterales bacterium]